MPTSGTSVTPGIPMQNSVLGDDLCRVIAAWPTLPEALKAAVLAIVRATKSVDP